VTITFAHPQADSEYYQRLLEGFYEKYPYITIDFKPQPTYDFGWIDTDDADTFVHSQFALDELLEDELILDLTPFIDEDQEFRADDFYPGTLSTYSRDGKTWAVPAGADVTVMFYNKDLFDARGVTYPEIGWTWDDLLSMGVQISDPDAGVFGYGPNYEVFDPLLFVYQGGGRVFDDLQNPTTTTFDDPANVEALEWFVDLIYEFNVAPSPDQIREAYSSTGGLYGGIIGGKIGMWTGTLAERGGESDSAEWPMSWGVVPMPIGEQAATLTTISAFFISAQSESPDACWQWISYISQYAPQRQTPVRRSLLESETYEQQVGAEVATAARVSMESSLLLSPKLVEFQQALGIFQQAIEAIITLRATPEEALVHAQNTVAR
jgi:ABC-type glycerol-3-phosphate transport system substrate-binding protein